MLHPAAVDQYVYIPSVSLAQFRDYASDLLLITQVASIRVALPSQGADLLFDGVAGRGIALEEDDISTGGCAGRRSGQHNESPESIASTAGCLIYSIEVVLHYLQRNSQSGPNSSSSAGYEDGFAL